MMRQSIGSTSVITTVMIRRFNAIRGSCISKISKSLVLSNNRQSHRKYYGIPISLWDSKIYGYNNFHTTISRYAAIPSLRNCIRHQPHMRFLSSTTIPDDDDNDDDIPPIGPVITPKFAVVHHGDAYKKAMEGLHGQQLAIAQLEGEGKDEPDFDPFLEEELEEARLIAEAQEEEEEANKHKMNIHSQQNAKAIDQPADTKISDISDSTDTNNHETQIDDHEIEMDPLSPKYQYKLFRHKYNNDGSLRRNKSEMAILRAGSPAGGKIAIIAIAGSQYKVTTDDVLIINLLQPVTQYTVGSIHTLTNEQILLVSSTSLSLIGMPYVPNAEVDVLVEEITRDAKVIVYKKRRRKNSQRKTGFRRDVTMLRILDIRFPDPYDEHDHVVRPDPAPLISHKIRKIM